MRWKLPIVLLVQCRETDMQYVVEIDICTGIKPDGSKTRDSVRRRIGVLGLARNFYYRMARSMPSTVQLGVICAARVYDGDKLLFIRDIDKPETMGPLV